MRLLVTCLFLSSLSFPVVASPGEGPVPTPKGGDEAPPPEEAIDDSKAPAPQIEQLKIFSGTWRCDGKANTDIAEEVPTKITLAFKSDLGGRWITLRLDEQKSKQNPHALTSTEVWGYSEALGGFVRNGADNQGGYYAGTSSGWVGDRFWWSTDTAWRGKKAKLKDTFTKVSEKEIRFERAVDVGGNGDTARVFFEGFCKR